MYKYKHLSGLDTETVFAYGATRVPIIGNPIRHGTQTPSIMTRGRQEQSCEGKRESRWKLSEISEKSLQCVVVG